MHGRIARGPNRKLVEQFDDHAKSRLGAHESYFAMQRAIDAIQAICAEPEIGKIYKGKVRKIVDFGAFVEIMPGTDGLLHISQLSQERVRRVEDVLHEGDEIMVKVLDVDRSGKIRLSLREAQEDLARQGK